jgi:hypothetical protein
MMVTRRDFTKSMGKGNNAYRKDVKKPKKAKKK